MEFKGRIQKVFPIQSGKSARGTEWSRQDFIFEYFEHETDRWSDKVLLSAMNERISEYDLHEEDVVVVGFGHSVREYQGKYFNEVRLYKLEKVKAVESSQTAQKAPQSTQQVVVEQQPTTPPANAEKSDDLPF